MIVASGSDTHRKDEDIVEHALADDTFVEEAGLIGRIVERTGIIFAMAFLASMAILIFEIFMRYALNSPTLWAHETTIFLCAISFVFGGLFCVSRDRHIRVVLVYDHVGPRIRRILDVVISILCAISAGFFAWASWQMVKRSWWTPGGDIRLEGTGSAWNPPTPALLKGFLFAVMIIMALQFVILAYNHARRGK